MNKLEVLYNKVKSGKVYEYIFEVVIQDLPLVHYHDTFDNNSYFECDSVNLTKHIKPLFGAMQGYHILELNDYIALIKFISPEKFKILSQNEVDNLFNLLSEEYSNGLRFAYRSLGVNLYVNPYSTSVEFGTKLSYYDDKRQVINDIAIYLYSHVNNHARLLFDSKFVDNSAQPSIKVEVDAR